MEQNSKAAPPPPPKVRPPPPSSKLVGSYPPPPKLDVRPPVRERSRSPARYPVPAKPARVVATPPPPTKNVALQSKPEPLREVLCLESYGLPCSCPSCEVKQGAVTKPSEVKVLVTKPGETGQKTLGSSLAVESPGKGRFAPAPKPKLDEVPSRPELGKPTATRPRPPQEQKSKTFHLWAAANTKMAAILAEQAKAYKLEAERPSTMLCTICKKKCSKITGAWCLCHHQAKFHEAPLMPHVIPNMEHFTLQIQALHQEIDKLRAALELERGGKSIEPEPALDFALRVESLVATKAAATVELFERETRALEVAETTQKTKQDQDAVERERKFEEERKETQRAMLLKEQAAREAAERDAAALADENIRQQEKAARDIAERDAAQRVRELAEREAAEKIRQNAERAAAERAGQEARESEAAELAQKEALKREIAEREAQEAARQAREEALEQEQQAARLAEEHRRAQEIAERQAAEAAQREAEIAAEREAVEARKRAEIQAEQEFLRVQSQERAERELAEVAKREIESARREAEAVEAALREAAEQEAKRQATQREIEAKEEAERQREREARQKSENEEAERAEKEAQQKVEKEEAEKEALQRLTERKAEMDAQAEQEAERAALEAEQLAEREALKREAEQKAEREAIQQREVKEAEDALQKATEKQERDAARKETLKLEAEEFGKHVRSARWVDSHWYDATILSQCDDGKFLVQFTEFPDDEPLALSWSSLSSHSAAQAEQEFGTDLPAVTLLSTRTDTTTSPSAVSERNDFIAKVKSAKWADGHWYAASIVSHDGDNFLVQFTEFPEQPPVSLPKESVSVLDAEETSEPTPARRETIVTRARTPVRPAKPPVPLKPAVGLPVPSVTPRSPPIPPLPKVVSPRIVPTLPQIISPLNANKAPAPPSPLPMSPVAPRPSPIMSDKEYMANARSAQWSDGHWYAATVVQRVDEDKFLVQFTDYPESIVLPCDRISTIDAKEAKSATPPKVRAVQDLMMVVQALHRLHEVWQGEDNPETKDDIREAIEEQLKLIASLSARSEEEASDPGVAQALRETASIAQQLGPAKKIPLDLELQGEVAKPIPADIKAKFDEMLSCTLVLTQGQNLRYGKKGKPKVPYHVSCTPDLQLLRLEKKKRLKLGSSVISVRLLDITGIQKGMDDTNFFVMHQAERHIFLSLELEADSKAVRDLWVKELQKAIGFVSTLSAVLPSRT